MRSPVTDRPPAGDDAVPPSSPAIIPDIPWLVALFTAALWTICRTMGTSPAVWEDTLIENLHLDDCLVHNRCTAVGVGATVGIFHSAGYLHFRSLLGWIGLDADGTYLTFLAMNALGVALVALAARRLGGRLAGALAALVMVASIGVPTQLNVITDLAPVPFLGAVFLLLALATTVRPSLGLTAVLGAVSGVMVNVYATGFLCGVSGVWIALLMPRRRWAHAAVSAASFSVTAFALSPLTWIVDARILLHQHTVGNGQTIDRHLLSHIPMARWTALAALAWGMSVVAAALGRPSLRRRLDVPAAIFLPLFAALVLGTSTGRLDPQDKYFAHVIGAVAVTGAVFFVEPVQAAWRWVVRRHPRLATGAPVLVALGWLAPFVAALVITAGDVSRAAQFGFIRFPTFTFRDLKSVAHVLGHERGWSWSRAAVNLRTQDEAVRRAAFRWATGWPETGAENNLERAYLLKVPTSMLPRPMPASVVTVTATRSDTTLLAFTCSWIDWRSFRVCVKTADRAEETCTRSGLPVARNGHMDYTVGVPGMPIMDPSHPARQTMTLHLPLTMTRECPETWIQMPRMPLLCPGRIMHVEGGAAEIEDNGRAVRLRSNDPSGEDAPREVAITWELGGPECWNQYRGYPPFFVEGDPRSVAFLTRILEQQMGIDLQRQIAQHVAIDRRQGRAPGVPGVPGVPAETIHAPEPRRTSEPQWGQEEPWW